MITEVSIGFMELGKGNQITRKTPVWTELRRMPG